MGARVGLVVATVMAAAWAWVALQLSGAAAGLILIPVALSLALLAWGWRTTGLLRSSGRNVGRVVAFWTAFEVVAIIATANLLQHFGRFDLEFPIAVIIVGLHFFGLARGIPTRLYYATGAGFIIAGLIGFMIPAALRPMVVGMLAAITLWLTSLAAILRARSAAPADARAAFGKA